MCNKLRFFWRGLFFCKNYRWVFCKKLLTSVDLYFKIKIVQTVNNKFEKEVKKMKKLKQIAETLAAVHTHTHTHLFLGDI